MSFAEMRETKKENIDFVDDDTVGDRCHKKKENPKSRDAILFLAVAIFPVFYLLLHHFAYNPAGTLQGKESGQVQGKKERMSVDGTNAGTALPFWDGACFSQVCRPARLAWPCTPGFSMCATTGSTCCWFRLYLVLSEQVSVGRPLKQPVPVTDQPFPSRGGDPFSNSQPFNRIRKCCNGLVIFFTMSPD